MRHEFGAMLCVFAAMGRLGVRMLTQPPRSADAPGSPAGSYTADD